MSRPWMPLYVADYLADTAHLSAAESGAYLHLIMHYWANGALPVDDRKLARIAKMTVEEWAAARETIAEFFADGWKHGRIEKELAEANASYERRANAGRKGGMASRKPEQSASNASALPKQSQPQPHIESQDSGSSPSLVDASPAAPRKASRAKPRTQIDERAMPTPADVDAAKRADLNREAMVREWTRFRDYHRSRGSLMADWSAAWRTWLGNIPAYQRPPQARAGPIPSGTYRNGPGAIAAEIFGNDERKTERPTEAYPLLPLDGDGGQSADGGDDRRVSRNALELLVAGSVRRM